MNTFLRILVTFLSLSVPTRASADLGADSPVKFPSGASLPAKYPTDRPAKDWKRVDGEFAISSTPERSIAQIDKIQAEMPAGRFSLPRTDWTALTRTRRTLLEGGKLRILAVGDSIIEDTMRSGWTAKLGEAYPRSEIEATLYMRGGGGCQHFKQDGRVGRNIIPRKPDLVLIGGISQQDIESIREVIHQIRDALPEVEILLLSGAFGPIDPRVPAELARGPHSGTGEYGKKLSGLAAEEKCAYLDMTSAWADYIRSTRVHPHLFYRDVVHANEFGEQILSRILIAYFKGGNP